MSDPRLTPEDLARIAELRRRIEERHPDVHETNALVRAALTPAPVVPTATDRKHAAQQALAMVTAAMEDPPHIDLGAQLREVDNIVLVVSSLIGLATGLLHSFEDLDRGSSGRWLSNIGLSLEMMGDEA